MLSSLIICSLLLQNNSFIKSTLGIILFKREKGGCVRGRYLLGRIVTVIWLCYHVNFNIFSYTHTRFCIWLCFAFSKLIWDLSVKGTERVRSINTYHIKCKMTFRNFSSCEGMILKYQTISKCIQKSACLILNTVCVQIIEDVVANPSEIKSSWFLILILRSITVRGKIFH